MKALTNCLALVFASVFFISGPVAAQHAHAINATKETPAKKYDAVYVVIKADFKKDLLLNIENHLKPWGVDFKVTDVTYTDGLITNLTVAVNVPGVYQGTLTTGNKQGPITEPVIFYAEPGKTGLANQIPADLSKRGTLVVTDNLKGMLILHNGESMQTMGSLSTNWKFPWNK